MWNVSVAPPDMNLSWLTDHEYPVVAPEGEFHVDLYTLPENLIRMLWEFTNEKVGRS